MEVLKARGRPRFRRDTGLRSPKAILVAQYSLLVSIGTGIAGVTYFTISGPEETVNLVGNTVNVATLMLSAAYLVIHQITSWRYCRGGTYLIPYPIKKLRSMCLRVCMLVIIAWLANSVLSLMAAARAPFCEAGAAAMLEWKSTTGCRIQRASVAGSIMAVVNSCLLFYGIKTSDKPFAASLIGIHVNAPAEEELRLSDQFIFATFEHVPAAKPFSLPSCNPSFYSSPPTAGPLPRTHRSWLPPLKFQPPLESEHPALQLIEERPVLTRTQTPLLPASLDQNVLPYPERSRTFSNSSKNSSNQIATASSSMYSRSTSVSDLSRNPSTLSSFSSGSFNGSRPSYSLTPKIRSSKPDVPTIPARYRHPSHSLRNGGQPLRPGSKPALPPAGFWMYARNEQQKQNDLLDGWRQTVWPNTTPIRPRADSNVGVVEASRTRYSSLPSPEKAVLRPNMNMANTMRVGKQSYESMRKGSISDVGFDFDFAVGDTSPSKSRDGRTLVKKRQPWDQEPRRGRSGS